MWKYTEFDAFEKISLHDCRANRITLVGEDLIFDFPEGFLLLPECGFAEADSPVKTGAAQVCFHGVYTDYPFGTLELFKTLYILRKPVLCRRILPEWKRFLKMFETGLFELEFICDYHSFRSRLFQCWLWNKKKSRHFECQIEITAKNVEFRWNKIHTDRKW